jgi:hypothetical protein
MLSAETKSRVLFALCYPARTLDETSMDYDSIVKDRLNGLDQYSEERVVFLLDSIQSVDEKVTSTTLMQNVKSIGDIELDNSVGIVNLKNEQRRLKTELSQLLGISNLCRGGSCGRVIL